MHLGGDIYDLHLYIITNVFNPRSIDWVNIVLYVSIATSPVSYSLYFSDHSLVSIAYH
jgi:hypothetical protein